MEKSDLRAEHEFLGRALKFLAGDAAAKEALPAVQEAFALAREAANADRAPDPDAISIFAAAVANYKRHARRTGASQDMALWVNDGYRCAQPILHSFIHPP